MTFIPKPAPGEYAAYAIMYIDLIPDGTNVIEFLEKALQSTPQLLRSLPAERTSTPFAEAEWTVKEILAHIMDQERVFVYRALRFARHDATEVAPFDHDAYVLHSGANRRDLEEMIAEYVSIRQATLTFLKSLADENLALSGKVGGNPTSVRALAWLTAGHEVHHLNSIREHYTR